MIHDSFFLSFLSTSPSPDIHLRPLTFINATCREVSKGIYSLNKKDELFRIIENEFNVSLDYKHVRIELLRKYRKDIVHNI